MEVNETRGGAENTFWESVRRQSRWGEYLTSRESNALRFAQQLVGAPAHALEVGCDGGFWSKQLADNGWRMICTDVNEHSLTVARQRIPSATCIRVSHDATTLPCESHSMSMILCIEVFEVANSSWFPFEAARVLKPGGVAIGVVNNSRSWRGQAYRVLRVLDPKRRMYTEDASMYKDTFSAIKARFATAGLSIVRAEGFAWLPFPRKSSSPLIPTLTRMEQNLGLTALPEISPWITFVAQKK